MSVELVQNVNRFDERPIILNLFVYKRLFLRAQNTDLYPNK